MKKPIKKLSKRPPSSIDKAAGLNFLYDHEKKKKRNIYYLFI